MVTPKDIGWGGYQSYEGPYYRGQVSFRASDSPTTAERVLSVVTATEGGHLDACNAYDRCILSLGLIQVCENGIYGCSELIGAVAEKSLQLYGNYHLLEPLQPALQESDATFKKNAKGRYRFFFNDGRGEVDTATEQQQLFLGRSNGQKGTWDDVSKMHAKVWAACCANLFEQPEAIQAQVEYLLPKLQNYAYGDAKTLMFGEPLPDDGWVGATRAAYLSFAANLPAVAAKHVMIAANASSDAKWSPEWCTNIIKQMTFGPAITIYPNRYNSIRPVLESLYGIDLPDFAADLQAWSAQHGVSTDDFTTTTQVQAELIAEGYDLGPSGADGRIGGKTTAAIMTFQRLHGLSADGLVGPKTRQALMAEAQKR